MASLGLIDLKRKEKNGHVRLLLTANDRVIGEARLRYWHPVAILISLKLLPEAKREEWCCHFEEWMIEQAKKEVTRCHCSRLIVYKENPTLEERRLYERLGFQKSIFGFCQAF